MNSWNKLPKEVQQVMEDLRVEQSEWTGKYMDDHVKAAMEWAQNEQKVEVIRLSPEEKARWDAKLAPLTAKWAAEAKDKGLTHSIGLSNFPSKEFREAQALSKAKLVTNQDSWWGG